MREEPREELYREGGAFRESEPLRGREGVFREGPATSTSTEGARTTAGGNTNLYATDVTISAFTFVPPSNALENLGFGGMGAG